MTDDKLHPTLKYLKTYGFLTKETVDLLDEALCLKTMGKTDNISFNDMMNEMARLYINSILDEDI